MPGLASLPSDADKGVRRSPPPPPVSEPPDPDDEQEEDALGDEWGEPLKDWSSDDTEPGDDEAFTEKVDRVVAREELV